VTAEIDRNAVRALVRRKLEERLGTALPHGTSAVGTLWSELEIAAGPECSDDFDFPVQKPCLIEPHRPCYNSGYCKKLGH